MSGFVFEESYIRALKRARTQKIAFWVLTSLFIVNIVIEIIAFPFQHWTDLIWFVGLSSVQVFCISMAIQNLRSSQDLVRKYQEMKDRWKEYALIERE